MSFRAPGARDSARRRRGSSVEREERQVERVQDVLQVAGLVAAGVVLYTLVALLVLAWLGHRYQRFTARLGDSALPPAPDRPLVPASV